VGGIVSALCVCMYVCMHILQTMYRKRESELYTDRSEGKCGVRMRGFLLLQIPTTDYTLCGGGRGRLGLTSMCLFALIGLSAEIQHEERRKLMSCLARHMKQYVYMYVHTYKSGAGCVTLFYL
jgi:hypothetical protein